MYTHLPYSRRKNLSFDTKTSLSWEKKAKFPIGMFCRKTRSAVGGIAAVQKNPVQRAKSSDTEEKK